MGTRCPIEGLRSEPQFDPPRHARASDPTPPPLGGRNFIKKKAKKKRKEKKNRTASRQRTNANANPNAKPTMTLLA